MKMFTVLAILSCVASIFAVQDLSAFDTPDIVYIRAFLDRESLLGSEIARVYDITGSGVHYLDIAVPAAEFDGLTEILPAYEVIYGSQEEKLEKTVGLNYARAFYDYDDMVGILEQTAVDHEDIVRLDTLGCSVEGRMILAARVTAGPDIEEEEPEFRIAGLHHGDELMSAEIPIAFLEYLTDNYGSDPIVTELVDGIEIWIIPMVNPDGRMATPFSSRYNANGVDLNRDYGYMWGEITPGEFSQPETRAVRENGIENNFALSLSFHTSGDIVNYVWNYSGFRYFIYTLSR